MKEQNIYVWIHGESDEVGSTMGSIAFCGKEDKCIKFFDDSNEESLKEEIRRVAHFFWRLKCKTFRCRVSAGGGLYDKKEKVYEYYFA